MRIAACILAVALLALTSVIPSASHAAATLRQLNLQPSDLRIAGLKEEHNDVFVATRAQAQGMYAGVLLFGGVSFDYFSFDRRSRGTFHYIVCDIAMYGTSAEATTGYALIEPTRRQRINAGLRPVAVTQIGSESQAWTVEEQGGHNELERQTSLLFVRNRYFVLIIQVGPSAQFTPTELLTLGHIVDRRIQAQG